MSHASLANDGLLLAILAAVLVLGTFIRAVFRAPLPPGQPLAPPVPGGAEPTGAHRPAGGTPRAVAAISPQPGPPAAGIAGQDSPTGYLPRHAVPGGPPWGPAPKPPGTDQLPGRHRPNARSPRHPTPPNLAAASAAWHQHARHDPPAGRTRKRCRRPHHANTRQPNRRRCGHAMTGTPPPKRSHCHAATAAPAASRRFLRHDAAPGHHHLRWGSIIKYRLDHHRR